MHIMQEKEEQKNYEKSRRSLQIGDSSPIEVKKNKLKKLSEFLLALKTKKLVLKRLDFK